jgi:hypothetical protein
LTAWQGKFDRLLTPKQGILGCTIWVMIDADFVASMAVWPNIEISLFGR